MPSEVGNAYLNVVPRLDGDGKSLGNKFGGELSSGASSALSAGAVAMGNILSDIVKSAASAVGDTLTKTFWNYADYEQLVGGVDTLFKDASQTVQENAKRAFETAGMSANDYMQNVTSFSASLISSLDGDTVKAAAVADKAMVDMSDNANKMGTDMEAITNAYQGFAKQNYTMLDNLKLGYGGTKTEMERLLSDASEIAGVEFNIDSYSDVIEAIHVIQESMDITGTTMEEGSTTISGSINQLSGAWDNFLTALGDGGKTMDLSQVSQDLIGSLGAVADNVIPTIGNIATTLSEQVPPALSSALQQLPGMLQETITSAFGQDAGDAAGSLIENVMGAFSSLNDAVTNNLMPGLEEAGGTISDTFTQWSELASGAANVIGQNLGPVFEIVSTAINICTDAAEGFISGIQYAMDTASQAGVFDALNDAFTRFGDALNTIRPLVEPVAAVVGDVLGSAFILAVDAVTVVLDVFSALVDFIAGVPDAFSNMVRAVSGFINGMKQNISNAFNNIRTTVGNIVRNISTTVGNIWSGIRNTVSNIVNGIRNTISNVFNGVRNTVSNIFNSIKSTVSSVWNGIKNAIMTPINAARDAVRGAIDTIKGIINGAHLSLPRFKLPHFNINGGKLPWGIGGQGSPPSISVDWYAKGGIVEGATLIGAGERGAELIWPSYDPYLSKYADAIAERMDGRGGVVINLNYDADADATQMVRDIARQVKLQRLAG